MTAEKHTILVVDDEISILKLLEYTFKPDYRVLTASSGADALEILRKEDVALIIADQRMPGMSGAEFLEKSIAIRPQAIRMVLTGYTDIESAIAAINAGRVYRYVTKPWEDEDLRINVRRAIETFDLQRANLRLLEELREANERLEEKVRLRTAELEEANEELRHAHQQVKQDLALAERVQRSLIPPSVKRSDVEIETFYRPMIGIGGDYAHQHLREQEISVAVCDVTGHGIAASCMANRVHMELVRLEQERATPAETIRAMNRFVYAQFAELGMYMTMIVGKIDLGKRRLAWASAGHPPALLLRAGSGSVERLAAASPVLGLEPELRGADDESEIALHAGDRLVLYTDGLSEARDGSGSLYGVDRLEKLLVEHGRSPLADLCGSLVSGVDSFRRGPATDDTLLVAIGFPGAGR